LRSQELILVAPSFAVLRPSISDPTETLGKVRVRGARPQALALLG